MKEYPGKITIAKVSCSDRENFLSIQIEDDKLKQVVHVEMKLADFTEAITGRGNMPCVVKSWREDIPPATFLPDCIFGNKTISGVRCSDSKNYRYGEHCSKRCETPTKEPK